MREVDVKVINNEIYKAFSKLCFKYDESTKLKLIDAYDESEGREKKVLELLLENEKEALEKSVPLCQDTGMAIVNMELGQDVRLVGADINEVINDAVSRAYKDAYLRCSVVDDPLFNRVNTKDNTPAIIHYEIVKGEDVKITCLAKGFGSENASKLIMLNPSDGIEGVKKEVIEQVKLKGANACPPLSIGIGIGGTFDYAAYMAKKALLRENEYNDNPLYKELEMELFQMINDLNIGPAGLKGKHTCLSVKIEEYPTHIAGLPLAININCHAVRKVVIKL